PEKPWVPFILAWALMETGKYEEAMQALESESLRNKECHYHIEALRACLFGAEGLADEKRFRKEMGKVLHQRLTEAEALSQRDLTRLFQKLTKAVTFLPIDDEIRKAFQLLSLQSG